MPRRSSNGQSLVELALILPLLLSMLMGTVEIGRIAFAQLALEEAVQEGVTYAARVPTNAAEAGARTRTSSNHAEVTGAIVGATICTAETVTLSATYPLVMTTPLGGALFGDIYQISATVVATNLTGSCS